MATTVLDIDGQITANWDTATGSPGSQHYDRINEGTDSPGPDDNNYIQTTTLADDDRFSFGATPANTNQVTQVDLRVRCGITDVSNAAYIACSIYKAGGSQVGSTQNIVARAAPASGALEVINDGTLETVTVTWSGTGFPLTKAEADGLEVKFVFNNV